MCETSTPLGEYAAGDNSSFLLATANPWVSGAVLDRDRPLAILARHFMERWQSGRMRRTRNAVYGQPYRGFESHPLRHVPPATRFHEAHPSENPSGYPGERLHGSHARGQFRRDQDEAPCVLKHLVSVILALAIAIATIWLHPPTHERAMYGTEGAPHENWQPREAGGWPMPYLADNPGVSVPHRLGIEDDFRPGAFVATFSFWLIVTTFLAVIARRLAAARRGGR